MGAAGGKGPAEEARSHLFDFLVGCLPGAVVAAKGIVPASAHMAVELGEWWPVGAG